MRAPRLDQSAHAVHEAGIVQVARGQVDGERLLEARDLPPVTLAERGLEDPVRQRRDQARLLGELHEHSRRHHAALRMLPAHQRLGAGEARGVDVNLGLAIEGKLAGLDRAAQIAEQPEAPPPLVVVHAAVEREMAVHAGAVHRHLRAPHQLVGIVAMSRIKRDADRAARVDLRAGEVDRPVQRLDDARRDVARMPRIGIAQQQHEFVLAYARERVLAAARDRGGALGDLGHQAIARGMPERVADLVEVADVNRQDRQRAVRRLRVGNGLRDPAAHRRPVRQSRERILKRHSLDRALGFLLPALHAQMRDAVAEIVREVGEQAGFRVVECVFVDRNERQATDDRAPGTKRKCAHRAIAAPRGIGAPLRQQRIAAQSAADRRRAGANRLARNARARGIPREMRSAEELRFGARVRQRPDRLRRVVVRVADPDDPITAFVDEYATHRLQKLAFRGRAQQHPVAGAQRAQYAVGVGQRVAAHFRLRRPVRATAARAHRESRHLRRRHGRRASRGARPACGRRRPRASRRRASRPDRNTRRCLRARPDRR